MNYRRLACSCVILVLLAQPVLADVVVLKNGEKYTGTLANREQVRAEPRASETIAILLSDSSELRRFPLADVEYLVLQDPDREQVIDLLSAPAGKAAPAPATYPIVHHENYSTELILLGVLAGGVGALVKFGGPKCTVTESSVSCDKKSYNSGNYGLMAFGALLVIIGIAEFSGGGYTADGQTLRDPCGPMVSVQTTGGSTGITVGYRLGL